ncbi:MAG: RDD family protein [Thermomicrobiaceae bacterium]
MNYQGVGIRFLATVLDSIVLMVPLFALGLVLGGTSGEADGASFALEGAAALLYMLISFSLWLGYYTVLEGTYGATLGKMILGLQVVHLDGSKINISTALVRNALRLIDGLFTYLVAAILIWTSPTRQRLGDRVAKTTVVRKASVTAPNTAKTS